MTIAIEQQNLEKAEQYFSDLKDALEYHRDLPSLDDFQYYCQLSIACAERLDSLPRNFWDKGRYGLGSIDTEQGKIYVCDEVINYGQQGNILRNSVSTVNALRLFFEGLVEGRYSRNQFETLSDFSEELRRYIATYIGFRRGGIL